MTVLTIQRVIALPQTLDPSTIYIVRGSEAALAEIYISGVDGSEVRHLINKSEIAAMIAAAGGGGGGGSATQLATARNISATGDATWTVVFDGSADVTAALSLAETGVAAGEYTVVTVDAKGRVTSARALTAADIPALDAAKITTGTLSRDTSGNAATATKLATARTINGVQFDGSADITITAEDSVARIAATEKGVANGVATLDGTGKVPASQLPSYVDDVLEFATETALPVTGEANKIYVTTDTNETFRWTGTQYIVVGAGTGVADSALILTTARSISITGDATWTTSFNGSADVTGVLTLSDTGVAAGAHTKVTVDSKGRVITGTSLTAADIPALDYTTVSSAGSVHLAASEW